MLELLRQLGACAPSAPLRVLGIDLGTTNSIAAQISWDGRSPDAFDVRCLEVSQPTLTGEYINTVVPSVIALHDDRIWVGEGAKRLRALARTSDFDRRRTLMRNTSLFYEVKNDIGTARTYPAAPPGFRSPKEVSARILQYLLESAKPRGKPQIVRSVVTVPASFQTAQRLDTIDAAHLAGLPLAEGDLLDEPLAAFLDFILTYGWEHAEDTGSTRRLLVFDFGGGTCDTAVFELGQDRSSGCISVAPLAVSRYHRLGGGDIDRVIAHDILIPQVEQQNDLSAFSLTYTEKSILIEALLGVAEALKISLCTEIARLKDFGKYDGEDKMRITSIQPHKTDCRVGGRRTLSLRSPTLSAHQLEELLQPFLDRDLLYARETEYYMTRSVFAPLRDALDRSDLEAGDVDFCLMVGGSSLIPQVREAMTGFFPSAKMLAYESHESLLTSVARGAAYHALFAQTLGHGLLTPIAHDGISLNTSQGLLEIISAGTKLPFPSLEPLFHTDDRLTVPETSLVEPLPLRLEAVAGAEQRPVYTAVWHLKPPVERGEALMLMYRYDTNQALYLQLRAGQAGQPAQWHTARIENPLTNVVNPQPERTNVLELEQKLRTGKVPSDKVPDVLVELADKCALLGQREKAIDVLRRALRHRQSPDPVVLNKMAILYGELGDIEREEKLYRQAADVTGWTGALFNLALSQWRRKDYRVAIDTLELALAREQEPPYLVLRAMLAGETGDSQGQARYREEALASYGPIDAQSDWKLGWFLTALRMRGDSEQAREVESELRRRQRPLTSDEPAQGFLPDMRLPPEED